MATRNDTQSNDGWSASAEAWVAEQGDAGDYGRRYVLDGPMVERISNRGFGTALDVGCGEGRFCRILRDHSIRPVGIDPTSALLDIARQRDPGGDYRLGRAETMVFGDEQFDLVVSYLSLIDIPDLAAGLTSMVAALRPKGTLLIANLTSFNTAGPSEGWTTGPDGTPYFYIDNYLEERANWVSWRGIRVQNWHRPLSTYMTLLLASGMQLRHFAEPVPRGGDPETAAKYRRVPWFHVMEWQKS